MHFHYLHILLCLCTLLFLSNAALPQTSRMLFGKYVTKSGNVTIYQDNYYSFYVYADFVYHYDYASDSDLDDPSLARMTLGLYTSQTILSEDTSGNCFGFSDYNCTYYGCTPYSSSPSTPALPNVVIYDGYYANAAVILDYSNWELKRNATITTSCSYNQFAYVVGSFGLIGLGLNGSQANFINTSSIFSIWLNKYISGGTLLFSSNIDVTSTSVYTGALQASADWNILSSDMLLTIDNTLVSNFSNISAIFDMNIIATGLPSQLFSAVIQGLVQQPGMYCEDGNYRPTCSYTGKMKEMPTITLTIQHVAIDLPPAIYVYGYSADTYAGPFTLNFGALDPSLENENFVAPEYENYIIFDRHFMSFYYTEFSFTDNIYAISLYNTYHPDSDTIIWPYIVGGVVGLILLVGIIVFCIKKRRNKRVKDQGQNIKGSNTSPVNDSSQALLTNGKPGDLSSVESYRQHDYTTQKYGYESWIAPDVPQSS